MGTYYGVKAVEAKGVLVQGHLSETPPYTPAGKRLVVIPENGVWKIAGDVTVRSEYDRMYESYASGDWLSGKLYLLDEKLVPECPDEGQVPII
ncbi:MAG: hypothetical protein JWL87_490 [Candidatus Adlerbacteria bacterium]|nr:hypothetical protein [Candidatus Adlerbacteria bacterium]